MPPANLHDVPPDRQRRLLRISRTFVIGFAVVAAGYFGALFLRGKYQDWHHLYHAMRAVVTGANPYEAGIQCYIYPPTFAVVFAPLGWLPEGLSGFIFAFISAGLMALALVLIARETCRLLKLGDEPWRVWTIAAVGMLFNIDKLRAVIYSGQSDHVILALLAVAFATVRRKPFIAGLCIGLSAVIKFQTIAFLPYFAIRRRWHECAGIVTGVAAGLSAGIPIFGWTTNWHYVATSLQGVLSLIGQAPSTTTSNINPLTWWASVSIPSALARITGYPANTALLASLLIAAAAGCVAVVAIIYRHNHQPLFVTRCGPVERDLSRGRLTCVEWSGIIVALIVFSPQAVGRHFALAVFPTILAAAFLLHPRTAAPRPWVLAAVIIYFAGLTLPPGGLMFDAALARWKHIGGASWCTLAAYLLLVAATLRSSRCAPAQIPVTSQS